MAIGDEPLTNGTWSTNKSCTHTTVWRNKLGKLKKHRGGLKPSAGRQQFRFRLGQAEIGASAGVECRVLCSMLKEYPARLPVMLIISITRRLSTIT